MAVGRALRLELVQFGFQYEFNSPHLGGRF